MLSASRVRGHHHSSAAGACSLLLKDGWRGFTTPVDSSRNGGETMRVLATRVQDMKSHASLLHDRLSDLHERFQQGDKQQQATGNLSADEWQQLWQQQVKGLTAAQTALRSNERAPHPEARNAAAGTLSSVERAVGALETSLSGV